MLEVPISVKLFPILIAGWFSFMPVQSMVYNLMDQDATTVVFRKWPDGSIDALMPELPADYNGNITAYTHIGQHSAADYKYVISQTVKASPEEYKNLKKELEDIGYKVKAREKYIPTKKD